LVLLHANAPSYVPVFSTFEFFDQTPMRSYDSVHIVIRLMSDHG
jgi:hypothetical protein